MPEIPPGGRGTTNQRDGSIPQKLSTMRLNAEMAAVKKGRKTVRALREYPILHGETVKGGAPGSWRR